MCRRAITGVITIVTGIVAEGMDTIMAVIMTGGMPGTVDAAELSSRPGLSRRRTASFSGGFVGAKPYEPVKDSFSKSE